MRFVALFLCACSASAPVIEDAAPAIADSVVAVDAAKPAELANDLAQTTGDDLSSVSLDMASAPSDLTACTPDLAPCTKNTDCCVHNGIQPGAQNIYASCNTVAGICETSWDLYNCYAGGRNPCHSSPSGDICSC